MNYKQIRHSMSNFFYLVSYLFVDLSSYLFIYLSVYLLMYLSVYLFMYLWIYGFICLWVYGFIYLFFNWHFHLPWIRWDSSLSIFEVIFREKNSQRLRCRLVRKKNASKGSISREPMVLFRSLSTTPIVS